MKQIVSAHFTLIIQRQMDIEESDRKNALLYKENLSNKTLHINWAVYMSLSASPLSICVSLLLSLSLSLSTLLPPPQKRKKINVENLA